MVICPICSDTFVDFDKTYRCVNGHAFDRAKEGYVNLLPVGMKNSKEPGDTRLAVTARHEFLNLGHYQPIAAKLSSIIGEHFASREENIVMLDSGCGEGYYLEQLQQDNHKLLALGFDISKPAIQLAAKKRAGCHFFVASAKTLPVAEQSVDVILNCFSPFFASNSALLRKGGLVIFVNGAEKHLIEMRQQLYAENVEHHFKPANLEDHLQQIGKYNLNYSIDLQTSKERSDLITMTPHHYRSTLEAQQKFIESDPQQVTADIVIYVYKMGEVNAPSMEL
ncbi:MAG: methyltransferase domain-containing protein [Pseudomonadales bacterium]